MNFFQVLAHEGEELLEEVIEVAGPALDQVIRSNSLKFSLIAGLVLLILTVVSVLIKQKSEALKYLLFGLMTVTILAATVYLVSSTIYLNNISVTGGPVHWHADFEIWNCGKEVELVDPKGLSNKVGTEVVHEHNDKRIHIEGVVLKKSDASISYFFKEVGSELHNNRLSIPTNQGFMTLENGQLCPDGKMGNLQVFVYKTVNKTFSQQKLTDPESYVISPEAQVPPGDCIIIEFDKPKTRSDKLCNFYQVAKEKGELIEQ